MNHDNIFKKYPPYIRDSLGCKATYFEGIIKQDLLQRTDVLVDCEYDLIHDVLSSSDLFYATPVEKEGYCLESRCYYTSDNGIIYIIFEEFNPMGIFPMMLPEEERYVAVHFSNDSEKFINDVINAFEEYYKCKIYYKECNKMRIISSEEIIIPEEKEQYD